MNSVLKSVCAMLKSARAEQRVAAAVVLSEIAPREPGVVSALTACLPTAPRPLRIAALEALGRIGSPAAVPAIMALLESPDAEVREGAVNALRAIGPGAVKSIAAQILEATPASRRALLEVLKGIASNDSIRALLTLVHSGHPDASREASDAIVALVPALGRSERSKLRIMLEEILRAPAGESPEGAFSAAMRAIASVAQPGTANLLLRLSGPRYPETVRRDALLAISGALKGGAIPPRIFAGILPMIQDGPSPALRSAALEVLGTVTLPASCLSSLLKLLDNPDPAVQRFAARCLGGKGLGGAKVAKRLIPHLSGNDPALRDAAADSLARMPESVPMLTEALLACDSVHRAWSVAHVLKAHAAQVRRPAARKIFDAAVTALVTEDRVWEPLLHVVRQVDPKLMHEWLMEASARFRGQRKYSEAEACLVPLSRGDHFDSEARYALALAGLRAARTRGSATLNAPFDLVRQLVRDPRFPLVDRLRKERSHIEPNDLYMLGFKLAEGSPEEKEAGAEILKTVAARAGATKLGRSARSKLRSEGLGL